MQLPHKLLLLTQLGKVVVVYSMHLLSQKLLLLLLPALMQISHSLCSTHVVCCLLLLLALHFYEQLNNLFVGRVAAANGCHKIVR